MQIGKNDPVTPTEPVAPPPAASPPKTHDAQAPAATLQQGDQGSQKPGEHEATPVAEGIFKAAGQVGGPGHGAYVLPAFKHLLESIEKSVKGGGPHPLEEKAKELRHFFEKAASGIRLEDLAADARKTVEEMKAGAAKWADDGRGHLEASTNHLSDMLKHIGEQTLWFPTLPPGQDLLNKLKDAKPSKAIEDVLKQINEQRKQFPTLPPSPELLAKLKEAGPPHQIADLFRRLIASDKH